LSYDFFYTVQAPSQIYTLSLHDALPIYVRPYGTSGTLGEAFASVARDSERHGRIHRVRSAGLHPFPNHAVPDRSCPRRKLASRRDRKSTRLNSSHVSISYAVFCLKKKKK